MSRLRHKISNEELVARYQGGDEGALVQLLEQNDRLIWKLALKYGGMTDACELDDLVSIGKMAMLRCASGFDLTSGVKFITYAWRAIEQEIWDEINTAGVIRLPKNREQREKYGESLARARGISSIDGMVDGDGGKLWEPVASGENDDVLVGMDASEERSALEWALTLLPEREQCVMRGRLAGKTFDEIGKELLLTRERIRQLETKCKSVVSLLVKVKLSGKPESWSLTKAELSFILMVRDSMTANAIARILCRSHITIASMAKRGKKFKTQDVFVWQSEHREFCERNRDRGWVWCAKELGVSPQALRSKVIRWGIQNKWKEITDFRKFRSLYDSGLTSGEMAKHFDVDMETIRVCCHKLGLKPPGLNARWRDSQKRRNYCGKLHQVKKALNDDRAAELGYPDLSRAEAVVMAALERFGDDGCNKHQLAEACTAVYAERGWPFKISNPNSILGILTKLCRAGLVGKVGVGKQLRVYRSLVLDKVVAVA